ncbi:MAG TPA: alkaline shock response membrane anchor protein AmaP [Bacillota bacterium]|nr:alkaline shock response membrane anchor protein AmaP [Bacillota bacterium]
MTLLDRVLLTIYALAVALISVFVISAFLGLPPAWNTMGILNAFSAWQAVPIAALFFLFSIRVLLSGLRKERSTKTALTQKTELGEVRISMDALQNVAQRAALSVRGIREAKTAVHTGEDGLLISTRVATYVQDNVPTLSTYLQGVVKQSVEESTGMTVKEVRVLVDDIAPANKVRLR